MTTLDLDIFVETNPAFCSLILFRFCKGYESEAGEGAPFPLMLLPLPLVMSGDLEKSFKGKRVDTGFYGWVDQSPDVLLDLAERVENSIPFTKEALSYGVEQRYLQINDEGKLKVEAQALWTYSVPSNARLLTTMSTYAERLGQWFGQINSTQTIYNHLGLEV